METRRVLHRNTCGTCEACCVFPEIDSLAKAPRVPCPHLRPGNVRGCCGIYGKRPEECRTFSCLFLLCPMPDHLRPDKSGFVLSIKESAPDVIEVWDLVGIQWEGSELSLWLSSQPGFEKYTLRIVRKELANEDPTGAAPPE